MLLEVSEIKKEVTWILDATQAEDFLCLINAHIKEKILQIILRIISKY